MVLGITEHQTIRNYLDKLSNSVPFLSWIIRPDGKVPPIGDSEEKEVSTDLAKKLTLGASKRKRKGWRFLLMAMLFGNQIMTNFI
jgi:hypothetical protein